MDLAALFQDTEPDQLNCHKLVIMYLVNTAGLCMSNRLVETPEDLSAERKCP